MKRVAIAFSLTLGWAVSGFAADASPVGDAAAGKSKSVVCGACHGADGNAATPFPKLAAGGQHVLWRESGIWQMGLVRLRPLLFH